MVIEAEKSKKGEEWLSCRDVLWYVAFSGFAINFMLRVNLSIAIVAMVVPREKAIASAQCSSNSNLESNFTTALVNSSTLMNTAKQNGENITSSNRTDYSDRFSWNEYDQGLALGGYYWLYWLMQVPSGILARRYGTKLVLGTSNLVSSFLGFLIPTAARYHIYAFIFLRVMEGCAAGFAWTSMHNMTAKWIPPNERSKFLSSYIGSSVGLAITYPLCGMLINWFGWESTFYVTSSLGVIWYIAWYFLIFDTPEEHPRISDAEKNYILENLGSAVSKNTRPVPWRAMLTSRPVWLIIISRFGGACGMHTLITESPSYFNYIHGWTISAAGIFSAIPHVMRMIFSYCFASFGDWLLRSNKMSITGLRKFASLVSNCVQSFMFLGLAFSGCHPTLAIIFVIAGMACNGATSTGNLAACIDVSPNYAGIVLGMANMVASSAGFIAPMLVGILTNENQTIGAWKLIFLITAVITFVSGLLFILFGTSELQPWNNARDEEAGEELQKLRSVVDHEIRKSGMNNPQDKQ